MNLYFRFGFYAYLKDLVTAPNAVMAYLCKLHKLHNIPLGDENTERNVDKVRYKIDECLNKFIPQSP